jgi:hypothetical protein
MAVPAKVTADGKTLAKPCLGGAVTVSNGMSRPPTSIAWAAAAASSPVGHGEIAGTVRFILYLDLVALFGLTASDARTPVYLFAGSS